jgi:hypothetical protein
MQDVSKARHSHNENIFRIQNQISSMHEHITSKLDRFSSKNTELFERHQKRPLFMDALKERSAVLQRYTEELLDRNRRFTEEKQTSERHLGLTI